MKYKNNFKNTIAMIILTALIAIGVSAFAYNFGKEPIFAAAVKPVVGAVSSDLNAASSLPLQSEAPTKPPATARIVGVGDNLIHEGIYSQAKRRANGVGFDFEYAYSETAPIVKLADIASINQETMLAKIFAPSSYPMFNSPTELGDHMVDIGFDVINQANNHSLDKGEKGILSTLDFWRTKPTTLVTGLYKDKADYEKIRTVTKNDITFAFIGMTQLTNGLSLPEKSNVILMQTGDHDEIKARIDAAKAIADVVVVNVHWGVEYTHTPNSIQRELAKKMVEWGADIIFGHHPHVIQPVEYITRPNGTKGMVCYSLGNFISAQDEGVRMLGGMLDVTVTKDFLKETTVISSARFVPIVTHYGKNFHNIKNYPLNSYTQKLAATHGVLEKTPDFSLNYLNNIVNNVISKEFLSSK